MRSFGSVKELLSYAEAERSKGERFATRFILVEGCRAWDELIPRLALTVDRVVRLSEFCSGNDVFPDLTRLLAYLKEETRGCQSIVLTPLAEHIRLDPDGAAVIPTLAEWSAYRLRRLYVPLLAAAEYLYPELEHVTRYKAGELPDLWELKGEGTAEIIVAGFSLRHPGRRTIQGIKEYLSLWEKSSVPKAWLVTSMAPWLPIQRVRSECRVRLYQSSFAYVRERTGWGELREGWGSPKQWEWLATQVQEGDDFDSLAARLLNVTEYDREQLFDLWRALDEGKQWLAWLWSKKRCGVNTYLHHVLQANRNLDEFKHDAVMTIFALPPSVALILERKKLLQNLNVNLMPEAFWERFGEVTDPREQMALLTDQSAAERERLVACTGQLLARQPRGSWWEYLETVFPALAWYLQPALTGDEFADRYFQVHNRCRVMDQADEELKQLVAEWAAQQLLWRYPARSAVLDRLRSEGAKVMWVDAMGAEWSGLLTRLLTQTGEVECTVRIARGSLPTTTQGNREWGAEESIERGLDDIAHHYAYQFPQSFLKAMDVIRNVAHAVFALLSKHATVVVTADHGLSRFAASSPYKISLPAGSTAEAPGRYAVLGEGSSGEATENLWVEDKGKAILLTHDRFNGGGPCHGETHGGAAPEECLVPIIILWKTGGKVQPHFQLQSDLVKLNSKNKGALIVRCNCKVESVELRVAGQAVLGQSGPGFTWTFSLTGLPTGKYTGQLFVANRPAGEVVFEAARGIIEEDLGL